MAISLDHHRWLSKFERWIRKIYIWMNAFCMQIMSCIEWVCEIGRGNRNFPNDQIQKCIEIVAIYREPITILFQFFHIHTHTHISSWRMREHSKQNGFFFIYCSVWILPFEDRHVLPLQYIHFVVVNKEEHDAQNTLIACWWIHMNRLSKAISNALALYVVCFSSSDSNKTFCLLSCILDI